MKPTSYKCKLKGRNLYSKLRRVILNTCLSVNIQLTFAVADRKHLQDNVLNPQATTNGSFSLVKFSINI